MTVELTTEIDPAWVPTILQLEYEASRPLYDFVFDTEAGARIPEGPVRLWGRRVGLPARQGGAAGR